MTSHLSACLSSRLLSGRKIHSQEEALAVRGPSRAWYGTGGTAHSGEGTGGTARGGEGTAASPWECETGSPSGQHPSSQAASLQGRGRVVNFLLHLVGHPQLCACQVWVNPLSALLTIAGVV